jgi:hypothetical protein
VLKRLHIRNNDLTDQEWREFRKLLVDFEETLGQWAARKIRKELSSARKCIETKSSSGGGVSYLETDEL